MSSCPDHPTNPLAQSCHQFSQHSFNTSSDLSSQVSLESLGASGEFDVEFEHPMQRFPFSVSIPTVVLRKPRTRRAYFVYMISISVRNTSTCFTWTVGHRYTTLARLHADLLGQSVNTSRLGDRHSSTEEEKEAEEWADRREPSRTDNDECVVDRPLAHPGLPRPLPGLVSVQFPRKRTIPTIPALAAGRIHSCMMDNTDWITCRREYIDYPVAIGQSHRVEQRRRALEHYLTRVLRLVWSVSQTEEVARVIQSVVTATKCQALLGLAESQPTPDEDSEALECIKRTMINLLPVLSETWN